MSANENVTCIFQLTDKKTISGWCSFKTKEVTERTQILSSKLRMKLTSKAGKKRGVIVDKNDVINIKKQINNVRLPVKDKE